MLDLAMQQLNAQLPKRKKSTNTPKRAARKADKIMGFPIGCGWCQVFSQRFL
jgi:hypothetical protein